MIDWNEINYLVDNNFRTISIPINGRLAGVRNDNEINVIVIRIPRQYRGSDLSTFNIRVNYVNANGDPNYQTITEESIVVEDEFILFAWTLAFDVTQYKGMVKFSVNLFTAEQDGTIIQNYHTTTADLKVLEGQDANESIDPETQIDILLHFENELSVYAEGLERDLDGLVTRAETAATNAENSATTAGAKANDAQYYASTAQSAKNLALQYSNDARLSKENAAASATNAETSATNAGNKATEAAGSASEAQGYKNEAKDYKDAAAASAEAAAQSAATFSTDKTLSIEDKAADAKATGDQITAIKSALTEVKGDVSTLEDDLSTLENDVAATKGALWNDATISGNPLVFESGSAQKAKSTIIKLEPIQEGSGYPSPDNVRPISGRTQLKVNGAGKNQFDIEKVTNKSSGGNIITNNHNGSITVHTPTTSSGTVGNNKLKDLADLVIGQKYTLTLTTTGTTKYIYLTVAGFTWENGQSQIITQAMLDSYVVYYASGNNTEATISDIQIELGETATEYEPYAEGVDITVGLGQTVYGGELDVVKGECKITWRSRLISQLAWVYHAPSGSIVYPYIECASSGIKGWVASSRKSEYIMSSIYAVEKATEIAKTKDKCIASSSSSIFISDSSYNSLDEFIEGIGNTQICFLLYEPTVITGLTPAQISLLEGVNTLWTDGDGIDLTYVNDVESIVDADNRITQVLGDIAPVEGATASTNYAVGAYLIFEDKFCKATTAIATGETIEIGTNVTQTTIAAELQAIFAQLN